MCFQAQQLLHEIIVDTIVNYAIVSVFVIVIIFVVIVAAIVIIITLM